MAPLFSHPFRFLPPAGPGSSLDSEEDPHAQQHEGDDLQEAETVGKLALLHQSETESILESRIFSANNINTH